MCQARFGEAGSREALTAYAEHDPHDEPGMCRIIKPFFAKHKPAGFILSLLGDIDLVVLNVIFDIAGEQTLKF